MKRKINIDPFDKYSIVKAIEYINDYEEYLEEKAKELCIRLAEYGVEVAKATIAGLPYDTGDLESNIYAIYDEKNHCAMFKADSEHAVFVEFGTGVVGEGTYTNPDYIAMAEEFGWQGYNTGGEQGKQDDETGAWLTIMNDGKIRYTRGQEAKHFMDDAGQAIQRDFEDYVRQVFNNND